MYDIDLDRARWSTSILPCLSICACACFCSLLCEAKCMLTGTVNARLSTEQIPRPIYVVP